MTRRLRSSHPVGQVTCGCSDAVAANPLCCKAGSHDSLAHDLLAPLTQHRAASFRSVGSMDGDAPSLSQVRLRSGMNLQLCSHGSCRVSIHSANSIPEPPRLQSIEASRVASRSSNKGTPPSLFRAAVTLGGCHTRGCHTRSWASLPSRVLSLAAALIRQQEHCSHIGRLPSSASKSARRRFSSVTLDTGNGNHIAALTQRSLVPDP